MSALGSQSIASSYEQLLHVDTDGGGNGTTLVPVKDGDNGTTFAMQLSTTTICIDNPTTSSSSQGGILRLQSDDGAVMASGHRLGVIEFAGAEDTSNTITVGARIEALTDNTWSASENGADLLFYTTDGNASESEQMRIRAGGNVGIGDDAPDCKLKIQELTHGSNIEFKMRAENDSGTGRTWTFTGDPDARTLSIGEGVQFIMDTANGHLGIGVTPEATNTNASALQVGGNAYLLSTKTQGASGEMDFGHNFYWAADGNQKHISTDEASQYRQGGGNHEFKSVASGSADATITWTRMMKLDINSRVSLSNNDSGVSNTIFGKNAGDSDGAGDYNVYIGELSGGTGTQTDASDANVGIGYNALTDITTGYANAAVGYYALQNVTTGHNNVSIGAEALNACTIGQYNIAIGRQTLYTDDEGNGTTAVGHNAGIFQNLSGTNTESKNTLMGKNAGYYNVTGTGNTMLGYHSGQGDSNQSNSNNTAVGSQALGAITTGDSNTVVGANAADDITIGSTNVAIGPNALGSETVGDRSIAIGSASLFTQVGASNNLAVYNVGVGHATGYYNETGQYNTMVGGLAGFGTNASASNNTGIGYKALYAIGSGGNNTAIGYQAGNLLTTGSSNVIIGYDADVDANDRDGCIIIGSGLSLNTASDNVVEIGNNTNSMTYDLDGGDITVTSDVRTKKNIKDTKIGLDFINKLRPITYQTKAPSEYAKEFGIENPSKKSNGKTWDGLIAQEVKEVMDEMDVGFSGWEEGINTKQRLAYGKFVMPLIKAIQELSAKVTELENKLK